MNPKPRGRASAAASALCAILLLCQPVAVRAVDASTTDEALEQLYRRGLQALAEQDLALAEALLKRLLQDSPRHAGAWMDLAVLYCHLGDEARARALWDEVEARFAPPPAIRELIALQRRQGCRPALAADAPALEGQLARGRSTNVNQGVRSLDVGLDGPGGTLFLTLLPEYAPRADGYTQAQLAWRQPLGGAAGITGFVHWQARRHDQERALDAQDAGVGVTSAGAWNGWRWHGQGSLGNLWLDGRAHQRSLQVRASASPPWQPWAAWRWGVDAASTRLAYPALQGFDARVWEGRVHATHAAPGVRWRLHLGLTGDDGQAQRPGGDREGWTLGATWRRTLGGQAARQWGLEAGLTVQHWRGRSAYAPGLIEQARVQRSRLAWAALTWPTGLDSAWVAELRQVRNDENIGLFAFDALAVQVGWQRRWRMLGQP